MHTDRPTVAPSECRGEAQHAMFLAMYDGDREAERLLRSIQSGFAEPEEALVWWKNRQTKKG